MRFNEKRIFSSAGFQYNSLKPFVFASLYLRVKPLKLGSGVLGRELPVAFAPTPFRVVSHASISVAKVV